MCLIIVSPRGKRIPEEYIKDAESRNRDGGGVAWLDKESKMIKFKRNLNGEEVIQVLKELEETVPHVVHFRIASVGGPDPRLTHPFVISAESPLEFEGEAKSVLFQNGTYGEWRERLLTAAINNPAFKVPPPPWSDARAVSVLCSFFGKHILSILGDCSRWLVFEADSEKKAITLWGDWKEKDGFKFSHEGNCAFETNRGRSGAANFTNRAGNNSGTGATTEPTGMTQSTNTSTEKQEKNTNSGENTTLAVATTSTQLIPTVIRSSTRYTIRPGHQPWKSFTDTGLSLVALNETPSGELILQK